MRRVQNRVQSQQQNSKNPLWSEEVEALVDGIAEMSPQRRRYALGQLLFFGSQAQRDEITRQITFARDERANPPTVSSVSL